MVFMPRRGFALTSVLVLAVLAVGVVLLVAALCGFQLSASSTAAASARALYLAEGAASTAIENIHQRHDASPPPPRPADVLFPGFTASEQGSVSFADGSSVDNTDGSLSGSVPAGVARVVATGQVNGRRRQIEVVLKQEPFNYAVAVAGDLNVTGDLDVTALDTMDQVTATPAPTPLPVNVGVGGNVGVSGTGRISGDLVVAPGATVQLGGVQVGGRIRSGNVDLPAIQVDAYDPSGRTDLAPLPSLSTAQVALDTGVYNYTGSGPMHVTGDLSLSAAVLYVHGDLRVDGGITGNGAVIVDGAVTVGRCASFSSTNLVALLANGDVTLQGTSENSSYFEGLVYSHGHFTASRVTVAGTFVTAPAAAGAPWPGVTLDSARVVYVPSAATIVIASSGASAASLFPIDSTRPKTTGAFDAYYDPAVYPQAHTIPAGAFYPGILGQAGPLVRDTVLASFASDPVVQKIWNPVPLVGPTPSPTPPDPVNAQYFMNFWVPDGGPNGGVYLFWPQIRYNPQTNRMESVGVPPYLGYISGSTAPCPAAEFDTRLRAYYGLSLAELQSGLSRIQQAVVDRANQLLASSNLGGTGAGSSLKLSLEQFLKNTLPLRVVSWRER